MIRRTSAEPRGASAATEPETYRCTTVFRAISPLRRVYALARRGRGGELAGPAAEAGGGRRGPSGPGYAAWIDRYDRLTDADVADLRHRLDSLDRTPTISLIMPVFDTPHDLLRRAIASVQRQIYQGWELCITDDCSTDDVVPTLVDEYVSGDERIRTVRLAQNGGIAAASNAALGLATGEWVAPLDHDDELAPHALAHIALAVAGQPQAAVVYTDEDKIDAEGRRHLPYFKPDFDPLLLLGQNYLAHLIAYRHDLVRKVGGYRERFDGSQDWDLTLRATELVTPEQVVHVPRVLYHWRSHPGSTATGVGAKPHAVNAGRIAVTDHLTRQRAGAHLDTDPSTGWHRARWPLPDPAPKVDVVVVAMTGRYVSTCRRALDERTDYPDYEVVVVTVPGEEPARALVNEAVARTDGTVACLLGAWYDVTDGQWLQEMVGQLFRNGVGAVGGTILDPDGTVRSAGQALDPDEVAVDLRQLDETEVVSEGRLRLAHRVSAVSSDFMAVRRSAWDEVGGFDADHLPTAFGDVDLCLRLGAAGWRTIWTPHAAVVHGGDGDAHLPGNSGDAEEPQRSAAAEYMQRRWAYELQRDPAMNPNLRATRNGVELAFPPG